MQNKSFSLGPTGLSATLTTNIMNCGITSLAGPIGFTMTQPYVLLQHVRVTNTTNGAASFTLYKGASGANVAGTELVKGKVVPANDSIDIFFGKGIRFDAADFLVGGASVGSNTLVMAAEGEIGISG